MTNLEKPAANNTLAKLRMRLDQVLNDNFLTGFQQDEALVQLALEFGLEAMRAVVRQRLREFIVTATAVLEA